MRLWKFSFLARLFCPDVFLVSLSLPWVSLCDSFSTDILRPPSLSHVLRLSFSHSCSASACLSGLEKTQQKEGMESCGLELHAYTQIMVGRRSSQTRLVQGLWSANTITQGLLRDPEGQDPHSRGVWSRLDEEGGVYGLMSVSRWRKHCFLVSMASICSAHFPPLNQHSMWFLA